MSARTIAPFDVIARVLAQRLQGCESSAELPAMVRSQRIDWERVVACASAQWVLPAFAAALRDLGLSQWLDEELRAFLAAVHAANLERNQELRAELAAAVGALNRVDIEPVLLKGAIRLLDRLYPDDGWRMLRDLDLLVPKARWADALHALRRAGYRPTREAALAALLRRRGGCVAIDVHLEPFSTSRRQRLLQGEELLSGVRPVVVEGHAVARIPSMLHQMLHLVGHSQISNFNHAYGRIGLRDRLEAGALARWAAEPVDWAAVFARFAAAGYRRPLLSFLLALRDGAFLDAPAPGAIDALTAFHTRRIAWQTRSKRLAQISLWPMWCVAMLRTQVEEREDGRPKFVNTLSRFFFERGAPRRMLRTFIQDAPRPW